MPYAVDLISAKELLVILPVRSRPVNLHRFLTSFTETYTPELTTLMIVFGDDYLTDYIGMPLHPGIGTVMDHDPPTSVKINWLAQSAGLQDKFRAMMFVGDDNLPLTPAWDRKLLDVLDRDLGGEGYVYPVSTRRPEWPELCLVSTRIIRALGWLALPALRHTYIDAVWQDLGTASGRMVRADRVVIQHRHYRDGMGAEFDETYERGESWAERDGAAYLHWKRNGGFAADLAKLALLDEQP